MPRYVNTLEIRSAIRGKRGVGQEYLGCSHFPDFSGFELVTIFMINGPGTGDHVHD